MRLSRFSQFLRGLLRRPVSLAAFVILTAFLLMAIFGSAAAPYPFDELVRGESGSVMRRMPPDGQFLLGTDRLGRDVYSRILWGAREVIAIPAAATVLAVLVGTTIGLLTGYFGGWLDEAISRVFDSLLAIPAIVLALVTLATIGPSTGGLITVIVLLYTPIVTRVIRSATLGLRSAGFVEAARLRGEPVWYILAREILPSVLPVLVVEAALRFSYAIFLTASLGFLGLGVQPPSPDWGRMVNEARADINTTPWALWAPAGAIALLVVSVNLVADELRRVFRYEGSST
jgi:peptide/nickel transport system permease protein